MNKFSALLILDFKRSLCRRNILIFLLFLVIALYMVQLGIDEYRLLEKDKQIFEQREALLEKLHTHDPCPNCGYRLFFMPTAMSVFFGSPGVLKRIEAYINDDSSRDIYSSLLNGSVFDSLSADFFSFSGFLLYGGFLLVMLFGYEAFLDREYIKTLSTLSLFQVFLSVFINRFLLILLFLYTVLAAAYLFAALHGIPLSSTSIIIIDFVFFGFNTWLISTVFLYLGMLMGNIRSRIYSMGALAACWIILMIVIPAAVGKYISTKAQRTSPVYRLGLERLKVREAYLEHDRKLINARNQKEMEELREANRKSMISPITQLAELEKHFILDFTDVLKQYLEVSEIFPSTYYLTQSQKLSTRGFLDLFDFYNYVRSKIPEPADSGWTPRERKLKRIILEREGHNYRVKLEGNIFHSRNLLFPDMQRKWFVYLSLQVGFLNFLTFFYFMLSVSGFPFRNPRENSHLEIALDRGKKHFFDAPVDFIRLFYNRLARVYPGYKGKLLLADEAFKTGKRHKFIYLGSPDCLPGHMRVRSFTAFIKRIGRLSKEEKKNLDAQLKAYNKKYVRNLDMDEKAEMVLKMMRFLESDIYMLKDFVYRMTLKGIQRLEKQLEDIQEKGAAVIYFNTYPTYHPPMNFDDRTLICREDDRYIKENLRSPFVPLWQKNKKK